MAALQNRRTWRFYPLLLLPLGTAFQCSLIGQPRPVFYRTDYLLPSSIDQASGLVIADVNNDGKPDFVVGAGQLINVALGNGDGTFQPFTSFVPSVAGLNGGTALASVAADFDGDGNIDLVLYSAGGVVILPGKGDGTFGAARLIASQAFSLPPIPFLQLLGVADLNHDGRPDLVLLVMTNGSPFVSSVLVFLNNGNGTFSSRVAFALPSNEYAVGVTIADFNRDGMLDLAVIGQPLLPAANVNGHVYVGLGKGDGSFSSPIAAAALKQVPNFITAADFNHDGIPDLAVDSGITSIFLANGDGSFRAAPDVNLGFVNPGWIAVADWTGSGNPGLGIFTGVTPNGIGIVAGNGDGSFYPAGTAALDVYSARAFQYSSADLNGDGRPDLIVTAGLTSDTGIVSVLLNGGVSPSFAPTSAATDITTVSAGSIATIYANFPFSATQSAQSLPPPLQLGGVTVNVRDSLGVSRPAPLYYVSPTQVNLVIPRDVAAGPAAVEVLSASSPVRGSTLVRNVVPSIFTDAAVTFQGGHYPAAYVLTYGPDGQAQPPFTVAACQSGPPVGCDLVPIPRPAGSRVFLELFATGIRNHISPVLVYLNGGPGPTRMIAPAYAGPQGQYDGLDQMNLEITNLPALTSPGARYTLFLNVDGLVSNAVQFSVQ